MADPKDPFVELLRAVFESVDRVLTVLIGPLAKPLTNVAKAITISLYGVEVGVGKATPIDKRLARLDTARVALEESLSAISELQAEGQRAKSEHAAAMTRLEQVLATKGDAEKQLAEVRAFYERDISTFKQLAGTPNMAVERVVAFGLGILASIVASVVWNYGDDFIAVITGFLG